MVYIYIYIVLDLVYKNVKGKGGEIGRIDRTNDNDVLLLQLFSENKTKNKLTSLW